MDEGPVASRKGISKFFHLRDSRKRVPLIVGILLLLIVFLLLSAIALFVLFRLRSFDILTEEEERPKTPFEVPAGWGCTSLDCSLNSTLDPCDDFYEFVCSGFMADMGTKVEAKEFTVKSQFHVLWDKGWTDVVALLNNQSLRHQSANSNAHMQQMFAFYDSCLDNRSREADQSRGLLAFLEEFGYQPGTVHQFNTDWTQRAFPFVPFFNLESTWDVRPETETKSMFMFQPKGQLTDFGQFASDPAREQAFAQKCQQLLRFLIDDDLASGREPIFVRKGISEAEIQREIERRVKSLIEMERRIGRAIDDYNGPWRRFANLSETELYMPIGELSRLYSPSINWLTVLHQLGQSDVSSSTEVLVIGSELLEAYGQIIATAQREQPQMLSDYLDWALVWRLLFELDQRYAALMKPWPKNERNCVRNFVRLYFKHWLDRLYVDNVFDKRLIDENELILSYVKRGFSQLLDEADWMEPASRQTAKRKLAALKQNIGYFRLLDNDELLDNLYANFSVSREMPWAQQFAHVHRQFYLWPVLDYQGSYWVDGFYKWVYNSLAIYAGIMWPPWFDHFRPAVMNFGAMGTFMGHEVTHGFDSAGWLFDERGNKKKSEHLETGTMEAMEQRMGCFVRQYGDYEGERPRPSARFTLAENIADNGAIRASYSAWHQFRAENPGLSEKLPAGRLGQFSEEQLFFISNAFMYCAAFPQDKQEEWYAQNDNHGFPRARVNLPLRNFPAFARAFQCPKGSPMHPPPERQCRLW